ncbi:redoxin domain-containing protein [Microbacterium sp. SLBN-146]|uniref:redoxin domain-containing protein n=1 Tax=Microbacterium sp. SLBN-146 TaxID=2768457 RepID=UPI001151A5CC|nr:redoxin domain-containing protein [Microbacterium sp. SLBN-146]TQJ30014.1 peroxiredoxin [Microbacterium sp. SLBN-146]
MTGKVERAANGILEVGSAAPDFTLHSTPDSTVTLSTLRGNPVVLVFYPADWSAVCGDELNVFNEAQALLHAYGAEVFGISVDGVWCHRAFVADRGFRFALLSDFEPKGAVSREYGAYDADTGTSRRALFVIDESGIVSWSHESPIDVNPGVDGVLDALDALASRTTPTT